MGSIAKSQYSAVPMDQDVEDPCTMQLIATASVVPVTKPSGDAFLEDEEDEEEIFPSYDDYFQGREGIVKVFDHGLNSSPSSGWFTVYSIMVCATLFLLFLSLLLQSGPMIMTLIPLLILEIVIGCFDCFERCFPAQLQLHTAITDRLLCHEIVPKAYAKIKRPCAIRIPFEKIESVKVVKTEHGIHNVEIGTLPDGSDDLDARFIASGIPPEDLFKRQDASPFAGALAGMLSQTPPRPMYVMTLYGLVDPYRLKRILSKRLAKSRPCETISVNDVNEPEIDV